MYGPALFGDRFGGKEGGLHTYMVLYKPSSKELWDKIDIVSSGLEL
jgi:hypothetical protein